MTTPTVKNSPEDYAREINSKLILHAVKERFPEWAAQYEPHANVLTLKAWNQKGYRVKKGEKAIPIAILDVLWKEEPEKGQKFQVGLRPGMAYFFALPQVERKNKSVQ